jgi:hypothetical protein
MKNSLLLILIGFTAYSQAQLIPCRAGRKWGYCDTGKIVRIATVYDFAEFFTGDIAFVKKDSVYYGINKRGETVTPSLKHYGNFSSGLCPVMLSTGSCCYINDQGKIAIDMYYDAAETFSEGLAVVSMNKKLGIIDTSGQWIRKPDFDTSSIYFKSGFLLGLSKGKYFYIKRDGKTLSLPDSIIPAGIFSEGLAPVYINRMLSSNGQMLPTTYLEFIDSSGRIVLNRFINDSQDYSGYIALEKEFRDGMAIIKTRNDIGWDYYYIDKKGRFSPLYASAKHLGDSMFLGVIGYYMSEVRILDKYFFVAGQFQSKPAQVGEFGDGLLPYCTKESKWGYMNSNCKVIIKPKYKYALKFTKGYAYVVLDDGQQGVIDTEGDEYFR